MSRARIRFLFQALRENFDVDLLLIGREGASVKAAWTNFKPLAMFTPQPAPFPRPASTPSFAPADRERFILLIREKKYAAVFCRFTIGWDLLKLVQQTAPETAVVVDVDMVSSRLVALTWAANPSFKKRWFLFEKWKLQRFEHRLFREPWLFLFTNSTELADVRDGVAPRPASGEFTLLPNIMPRAAEPMVERQPVILFFGSLDSSANVDGFQFLVDEVLPQIEADLKRHNVKIRIAGKNPPAAFAERLRAIGKAWSGSPSEYNFVKTVLLGWVSDMRHDAKFCAREKRLGELAHAARIRWQQRRGKLAGFRHGWQEAHPTT